MTERAYASSIGPGRRLGRYEVCAELASGGMATVFLARATGPAGFDKLVALKVVHQRLAHDRVFVEMFLDEARIASRITHPNVGSVFDVGDEGGVYFLAMDYLHGESLASVLGCVAQRPDVRVSPRLPSYLATIVASAAEGLHAAHELTGNAGQPLHVVHRDVSPHNVFVTYDGGVRVVDFGIARAAGRLHQTMSGVVKGKVAYMSPEQLRGEEIDRRTDIWALGVTLWELLACRRLFRRDTQAKTITAVLEEPMRPPSDFAPHVPVALDRIVMSALDRDPARRPTSARELGRELRRAVAATGDVFGTAELAELMEDLFAGHRDAKQRMIEQARSGAVVRDVPDTQRFARAEGSLPTSIEEVSDMRPRGREETGTLPHGTMQVEPAPRPAKREPTSSTLVTREAREDADDAEAAPPARPTFSTGSVVLPVRRGARWAALGIVIVIVALVAALALLASDESETGQPEPGSVAAPVPASEPEPVPGSGSESGSESESVSDSVSDSVSGSESDSVSGPGSGSGSEMSSAPSPSRMRLRAGMRTLSPRAEHETTEPVRPAPPGLVRVGVTGGWGTVAIDGRPVGQAPRLFEVTPGRHEIVVRPFGDGPPETRSVTVASGETVQVVVAAP